MIICPAGSFNISCFLELWLEKGIAGCRVVTTNSKTCEICLWERKSEIDLVSRMTFMDIHQIPITKFLNGYNFDLMIIRDFTNINSRKELVISSIFLQCVKIN